MKQIHQDCMKIWNWSKSNDNMYFDVEANFGVLFEVHLRHSIYHFEAWDVRSPTLQTMWKFELKQRSYGHLKTTAQSWKSILKLFRNSTYEFEIQFKMSSISNLPTATLVFSLLYLDNCTYGTPSPLNEPHTTRNHHFILFLVIFR